MSRYFVILIVIFAACHEANDPEDRVTAIDSDSLALACEEDLTCPNGGTCDARTLKCVDCLSDSDCAEGVCDPRANVCVQCVDDGDCDNGFCHPTRALCVGCWNDGQCGSGTCHPDLLACVECLADSDCKAPGNVNARCNVETFACTGDCTRDSECSDNDPCTTDVCDNGVCGYTELEGCGCEDVDCPPGTHPIDIDQDLCSDACECDAQPVCPVDTKPSDSDQDGCNDTCLCPNGAALGPDGSCPCPTGVLCGGGLVPSDLDADGCADTCTIPCGEDCDCVAQGLASNARCEAACPDCGPAVLCQNGICTGHCDEVREPVCDCPSPPACGPLETAVDTDQDGCNDTCTCIITANGDRPEPGQCGCVAAIDCPTASHPIDSNEDGCDDTCACDDPTREPRADGSCCKPLECPDGAFAADKSGDACPDVCLCPNGTPAGDTCLCEDGSFPGPNGCGECLATCSDQELPPYAFFVDLDGDGCYDLADACPVGTQAQRSENGGCPDVCKGCDQLVECPERATPIDADGDNCPDLCVCNNGEQAPEEGCRCDSEIACGPGTVAVDRDSDGCLDDCAAPCATACDCTKELALSADLAPQCATDCADCNVVGSCVEGFCAFDCGVLSPGGVACVVTPEAQPVCGCDDKTYESSCAASNANVQVKREGACETSGCVSDADCAAGQLCELPTGACQVNGEPAFIPNEQRGECIDVPSACLSDGGAVCGCDGKTYANDCERRKAGVARARVGACEVR